MYAEFQKTFGENRDFRRRKNIISIKEKLKSGDYILVGIRANDNGKPSTDGIEISPKVGDVVTIYKDGKPLKEVEVLSQILVIDSEQISGGSSTGEEQS